MKIKDINQVNVKQIVMEVVHIYLNILNIINVQWHALKKIAKKNKCYVSLDLY